MATPMKPLSDLLKTVEDNEEDARLLAYVINLYHYSVNPCRSSLVAKDVYIMMSIFESLKVAQKIPHYQRKENGNGNAEQRSERPDSRRSSIVGDTANDLNLLGGLPGANDHTTQE